MHWRQLFVPAPGKAERKRGMIKVPTIGGIFDHFSQRVLQEQKKEGINEHVQKRYKHLDLNDGRAILETFVLLLSHTNNELTQGESPSPHSDNGLKSPCPCIEFPRGFAIHPRRDVLIPGHFIVRPGIIKCSILVFEPFLLGSKLPVNAFAS